MAIEFVAAPEAEREPDGPGDGRELPSWPASGRSVAGTIVAVLLVFYIFYFAAPLLVPIAAAVMLSMLLAPAVQLLERVRIPRILASAIVVLSVMGLLGAAIIALSGPAKIWVERTTLTVQKLEQRFRGTTQPIEAIKRATGQL